MEANISGQLEIDEDIAFQRKAWQVQRIGWVILTLLIICALLGLLGGMGMFSTATLGSEAVGFQLTYARFTRLLKPTSLRIEVAIQEGSQSPVQLFISQDYLDSIEIEQITPNPETVYAASDRLVYSFPVVPSANSIVVTFDFKLDVFGLISGRLGLENRQALEFMQVVYP